MDSQIEVHGTLGVAPTEEKLPVTNVSKPTRTFQEVKVYQGSLPKTNQLPESSLLFLGVILCLIAIVLGKLKKIQQKPIC
ncbi:MULTISPECIES: hypothetical protein [Enterococcus]|uniref:LPXTG cell wall anchor domain-containing protein n=1 Tax=Enterococcus alishanensis TaxID=1303817 RepID=A0ABS6TCV0_9ENTE|nr:hypothetical protein [Enterococcus alishanensis]MBV7390707.1 hypothetical protein [Enterococcus alishanensis]